jgi:ferrous iron transport protein B
LVVFSLYLLGILTAIVLGIVLKGTFFKGQEQTPFVMELPPYRLPTFRNIWSYVWTRTSAFIHNAWTIILVTSIVIWLLMATPIGGNGAFANTDITSSAFATVSGAVAKIFTPLGFGNWRAGGALVTGFVAKEVVVSTMAQVYNVEEVEEAAEPTTFIQDVGEIVTSFAGATVDTIKSIPLIVGINLFGEEEDEAPTELMSAVRASFESTSGGHGALAALAFMVFVLLYTPCVVAIAAERQELGARWMWFSVIGQFVLAWMAAFIVFQGGKLLGLG